MPYSLEKSNLDRDERADRILARVDAFGKRLDRVETLMGELKVAVLELKLELREIRNEIECDQPAAVSSLGRAEGNCISRPVTGKPKPKTVELVRTSYQPTKSEKQERFHTNASFEEAVDALLAPVSARWIDQPRNRRAKR